MEPASTLAPATILAFNLSGTSPAAAAFIRAEARARDATCSVLSETKFAGAPAARDLAAAVGGRIFYQDAPVNEAHVTTQYGVAILVHSDTAEIEEVGAHSDGFIALSISLPGARPFLLIGAYLPPAASPVKERRQSVLTCVSELITREAHKYSTVVLAGDLNAQIGDLNGRRHSALPAQNSRALVDTILRPHNMSPIAGRYSTADATSPPIMAQRGQAVVPVTEVDYIITHNTTPAIALCLDYVGERGWHRPVGAIIALEPAGIAAPPPPAKRRRPQRPPPYGSSYWTDAFHSVNNDLDAIAYAARAGASVDDLYGRLTRVLASPQRDVAPRMWRYREYRGLALPPAAAVQLDDARQLRKRAQATGNLVERARLSAQADTLKDLAMREARRARNKAWAAFARRLDDARTRDPRGLVRAITETAPGTNRSNTDRPSSSLPAYVKHYRDQSTRPDCHPKLWEAFYPLLPAAARKPWAHYNWVEIYLVLFPFNERVFAALKLAGGHTAQCSPTCTQCTAYCTQGDAHVADPAKVPAPRWSPMLKVDRATGLDEISAEAMRFIRSHDHEETVEYRIRLSQTLALFFDRMIADGTPAGLMDSVMTAVPKMQKSGDLPDPAIPDETRGVTVHNALAKLGETLIDVRFMHVCVTEKIISPIQAGFMPGCSAEHCVFTLLETARARLRANLETWILFIDWSKAYDNISTSGMWDALRRIGFHARIVAYLQHCYSVRRTLFTFNGRPADMWEQLLGLPQGGVLSCLLFNMFIESLSRYLESKKDTIPGVDVTTPGGTANVQHILFADDGAGFAGTRGQLVKLTEHIDKWSRDHFLNLSVKGADKTAFMRVTTVPNPPPEEPLRVRRPGADRTKDLLIPETRAYKYIGHVVTSDMDPAPLQKVVLKKLGAAYTKFMHGGIISRLGLQTQRMLLLNTVVGATANLMALVTPGPQFEAAVTKLYLQACARVFRTSKQYIGLTGLADMRIRTASSVLLTARERFRISLSVRAPHATQLFRVLLADTVDPANARAQKGIPANQRSWAAWHYDALRRSGFDPTWRIDVDLTRATTMPWEPTLHANEPAAQMAALAWAKQARQELGKYARNRARNRGHGKARRP